MLRPFAWAALSFLAAVGTEAATSAPAPDGMLATELQRFTLPGLPAANELKALRSLYDRSGSQRLWSVHERPSPQADALVGLLGSVQSYGLRPGDYAADLIAAQRARLSSPQSGSAFDWQHFDFMLSLAAIRLISHLHYGRIEPRIAGFELPESRNDLDVATTVNALTNATRVADVIASAEPHFYHYGLLEKALARYRDLAADPSLTDLPPFGQRSLHLGDSYHGTQALRRLLTAVGDLSADARQLPSQATLDRPTVEALKRFQERHGLPADGALGSATFAALATPLALRVRQIELTLERWRWLPPFDTPPIIVNIPEFSLFALRTTSDRAADILQMPVIVGRTYPRTRTPIFVGDLKRVIFRPYWDIPRSITVNEMLPQIRAHADYLQRNDLEIVRGPGDDALPVEAAPATIAALAAGQLRLRQRPGDDNALGLVKFVFPNEHNVYMHATPAHQLFLQPRRAFSHGCIRVSDPVGLAAFVLRHEAETWDVQHILTAMHAARPSRVELRQPIRVMILYATALATEAGPIRFFDDIYGHDRRLEQLLDLQPIHAMQGLR